MGLSNSEALIEDEQKAKEKIREFKDKIEYEETLCLIKLVWSYMVFTSSQETSFKEDNTQLWRRLISLLNQKVRTIMIMLLVATFPVE